MTPTTQPPPHAARYEEHAALALTEGNGVQVSIHGITAGQVRLTAPRKRYTVPLWDAEEPGYALARFTPAPEMLEIQSVPEFYREFSHVDTPLLESDLFEFVHEAMIERDWDARRRAGVWTTINRALTLDEQGYQLKPLGQMRYEVTGGTEPYEYDYATGFCTCPMGKGGVCLHSIWAEWKIAEAMRLAEGMK